MRDSSRPIFVRDATAEDWPAIAELLGASALPLAGAREHLPEFVVCVDEQGAVEGCAGAERYGRIGLLRSVAVANTAQRSGVGRALVGRVLSRLEAHDVTTVALLTTSAEPYFRAFGFRPVDRSRLPPELAGSAELKGACPASAVAMLLDLRDRGG
jgi:amino-acid N-acetyltransferase